MFVFADGSLGLIDFGAVGRLDAIQQAAVVDILLAVVRRDVSLLRNGIESVAEISEATSSERLERTLARLLADHVHASGAIDATVLQDLVSTLAQFGVRLPGDLVILARALMTVDGTLRVISPGFSLVTAATEMMTSTTSPPVVDQRAMLRDELLSVLPHLRRMPDRIDRILTLTGTRRAPDPQRDGRGRSSPPAHVRQPRPPLGDRRGVPPGVVDPARGRPTRGHQSRRGPGCSRSSVT